MSQSRPTHHQLDDEIDLRELCQIIWNGKWYIFTSILLFSVLGLAYALYKPDIYQATVLVTPIQEESRGLSSVGGQLGSLASLAGVSIGEDGSNRITLAKEIMQSRAFLLEFIHRNNLVKPLFAVDGWNSGENRWIYDESRYDPSADEWLKDGEGKTKEPTNWEMVTVFKEENLRINHNEDTGMISVGIRHYSPQLAKKIVESLLDQINEYMRQQDVKESEARIGYLEAKLQETSISGMQQMFYQLIENETRTLMLANARKEYILKTVDPALVPEEPVEPKRVVILIIAVLLGAGVGLFLTLAKALLVEPKHVPKMD